MSEQNAEILKPKEDLPPEVKPFDKTAFKKFGILSSPWIFVPMLYIVGGLVEGGILINGLGIMYKDFGYSNSFIGAMALLNLPLIFCFLWAPYVDSWGSKRNLSVLFFFMTVAGMLLVTASVYFQVSFTITSVAAFFLIAVILSFYRIATDGYYIRALSPKMQAEFVGIKAAGIRIGILGTSGFFIILAGKINEANPASAPSLGWAWMFIAMTGLVFLFALYNLFFLPKTPNDLPVKRQGFALKEVIKEYFTQEKIYAILFFILVYRFGQALLAKMADPFFMDPLETGGMGLTVANLSMIRSLSGIPFMTIGGILGGFIIKKWGLKMTFIPLATLQAVPNIGYWVLTKTHSLASFSFKGFEIPYDIYGVMSIEALGYGMGFAAFFYFIHAIATGRNKTSTFAISTALMGLGWNIPCAISGYLQEATSYEMIFILSVVLSIPGIAIIPFLPMPELKD